MEEKILKDLVIILTIIILFFFLHRQNKQNGIVSAYSGVLFSLILYFGFVPLIILNMKKIDKNNGYAQMIFSSNLKDFFVAIFAVILFLATFTFIYHLYNKKTIYNKYFFDLKRWLLACKLVTWITFIIGIITLMIYIRAFGGVGSLLSKAEYLRSFATSGTSIVSYVASLLVIPARLITVTPIAVLSIINNKTKFRIVYKIIFIISLVFTIIFYLANAGRTSIIILILMFGIPLLQRFTKYPWRVAIVLGCIALPFLGILDALFLYMQNGEWNYVFEDLSSYITQFSYPWSNVLSMGKIVDIFGFRWGQDYITGVLNIIPGINFSTSYEPTSFFYGGSNWKITGGTPNDIITFSYMQLGYIGVIVTATLFGIIIGKIDRSLGQFDENYAYEVIKASVILNIFTFVVNSDISSLMRNQFQLTFVCVCILYSCKKEKG